MTLGQIKNGSGEKSFPFLLVVAGAILLGAIALATSVALPSSDTLKAQLSGNAAESSNVSMACRADTNHDGIVDIFDLVLVGRAFGKKSNEPEFNPIADLQSNNQIDILDLVQVARLFGESCTSDSIGDKPIYRANEVLLNQDFGISTDTDLSDPAVQKEILAEINRKYEMQWDLSLLDPTDPGIPADIDGVRKILYFQQFAMAGNEKIPVENGFVAIILNSDFGNDTLSNQYMYDVAPATPSITSTQIRDTYTASAAVEPSVNLVYSSLFPNSTSAPLLAYRTTFSPASASDQLIAGGQENECTIDTECEADGGERCINGSCIQPGGEGASCNAAALNDDGTSHDCREGLACNSVLNICHMPKENDPCVPYGTDCGIGADNTGLQCLYASSEQSYSCQIPTTGIVGNGDGLTATYFSTPDLTGDGITRIDSRVDFDWGDGSPMDGIPTDGFSVRWEGWFLPPMVGYVAFEVDSDDGHRLWLNNNELQIDTWDGTGMQQGYNYYYFLTTDPVPIQMEYRDIQDAASVRLTWYRPPNGEIQEVIPTSQLYTTQPEIVAPEVQPTEITRQPRDVTVDEGESATVSVGVSGTGPFTYAWKKDGTAMTNEIKSYVSFTAGIADDNTHYSVTVTGKDGAVTSDEVTVHVVPIPGPTITVQPHTATIHEGDTATFSVQAKGPGELSYQWQQNGEDIPDATSPLLTVSNVTAADNRYRVVVSNGHGSVTSTAAGIAFATADQTLASDYLGYTVYTDAQTGEVLYKESNWKSAPTTPLTSTVATYKVNPARQCELPNSPVTPYIPGTLSPVPIASHIPYTGSGECTPSVAVIGGLAGKKLSLPNLTVTSDTGPLPQYIPITKNDVTLEQCESEQCVDSTYSCRSGWQQKYVCSSIEEYPTLPCAKYDYYMCTERRYITGQDYAGNTIYNCDKKDAFQAECCTAQKISEDEASKLNKFVELVYKKCVEEGDPEWHVSWPDFLKNPPSPGDQCKLGSSQIDPDYSSLPQMPYVCDSIPGNYGYCRTWEAIQYCPDGDINSSCSSFQTVPGDQVCAEYKSTCTSTVTIPSYSKEVQSSINDCPWYSTTGSCADKGSDCVECTVPIVSVTRPERTVCTDSALQCQKWESKPEPHFSDSIGSFLSFTGATPTSDTYATKYGLKCAIKNHIQQRSSVLKKAPGFSLDSAAASDQIAQQNVFAALIDPRVASVSTQLTANQKQTVQISDGWSPLEVTAQEYFKDTGNAAFIDRTWPFSSAIPTFSPNDPGSAVKIAAKTFSSPERLKKVCGSTTACVLTSQHPNKPSILNIHDTAAVDNEVVYHEFTHILLDSVNPLLGKSKLFEARALQEGLADYFGILFAMYPIKVQCEQPGVNCQYTGVDFSDMDYFGEYAYKNAGEPQYPALQRAKSIGTSADTFAYKSFQTDTTFENEGSKVAAVLLKLDKNINTQIQDPAIRRAVILLYYQTIEKAIKQLTEPLLTADQHTPLIPQFYGLIYNNFKKLAKNNATADQFAEQFKEIIYKDAKAGLVIGNSVWVPPATALQWSGMCSPHFATPVYTFNIPFMSIDSTAHEMEIRFVSEKTGTVVSTQTAALAQEEIGTPSILTLPLFMTVREPLNVEMTIRDMEGHESDAVLGGVGAPAEAGETTAYLLPTSPWACANGSTFGMTTATPDTLLRDTENTNAPAFLNTLEKIHGTPVSDFQLSSPSIDFEESAQYLFDTLVQGVKDLNAEYEQYNQPTARAEALLARVLLAAEPKPPAPPKPPRNEDEAGGIKSIELKEFIENCKNFRAMSHDYQLTALKNLNPDYLFCGTPDELQSVQNFYNGPEGDGYLPPDFAVVPLIRDIAKQIMMGKSGCYKTKVLHGWQYQCGMFNINTRNELIDSGRFPERFPGVAEANWEPSEIVHKPAQDLAMHVTNLALMTTGIAEAKFIKNAAEGKTLGTMLGGVGELEFKETVSVVDDAVTLLAEKRVQTAIQALQEASPAFVKEIDTLRMSVQNMMNKQKILTNTLKTAIENKASPDTLIGLRKLVHDGALELEEEVYLLNRTLQNAKLAESVVAGDLPLDVMKELEKVPVRTQVASGIASKEMPILTGPRAAEAQGLIRLSDVKRLQRVNVMIREQSDTIGSLPTILEKSRGPTPTDWGAAQTGLNETFSPIALPIVIENETGKIVAYGDFHIFAKEFFVVSKSSWTEQWVLKEGYSTARINFSMSMEVEENAIHITRKLTGVSSYVPSAGETVATPSSEMMDVLKESVNRAKPLFDLDYTMSG